MPEVEQLLKVDLELLPSCVKRLIGNLGLLGDFGRDLGQGKLGVPLTELREIVLEEPVQLQEVTIPTVNLPALFTSFEILDDNSELHELAGCPLPRWYCHIKGFSFHLTRSIRIR